jgi:hypothetical protein
MKLRGGDVNPVLLQVRALFLKIRAGAKRCDLPGQLLDSPREFG